MCSGPRDSSKMVGECPCVCGQLDHSLLILAGHLLETIVRTVNLGGKEKREAKGEKKKSKDKSPEKWDVSPVQQSHSVLWAGPYKEEIESGCSWGLAWNCSWHVLGSCKFCMCWHKVLFWEALKKPFYNRGSSAFYCGIHRQDTWLCALPCPRVATEEKASRNKTSWIHYGASNINNSLISYFRRM